MKAKDNRIKLMFLAIQKDNFDQFETYFKECSNNFDVNNLRNISENSAVHVAAQHGRLSILRYYMRHFKSFHNAHYTRKLCIELLDTLSKKKELVLV